MKNIEQKNVIEAFVYLGETIKNEIKSIEFQNVIHESCLENTWFSHENIENALLALSTWLENKTLERFCVDYAYSKNPKTIAVIMAGNIPCVGFSDMMCVLLSGHKLLGKLSHSDRILLPFLANILKEREPNIAERIEFSEGVISNFDAVIATGSDNSANYFEYYFEKYQHIIRKNRTSIAVLDGNSKSLHLLADDILLYMGLGCRNVSKIYVPMGFDFSPLSKCLQKYSDLLNHNKYRNNYDYHKTIFLMNNVHFIDTNVVLLREDNSIYSPVSVLNYQYYDKIDSVLCEIEINKEKLQCIASDIAQIKSSIPFGKTQQPSINDFADGVDTMRFLEKII
jgi:hypothetical protein